MQFRSLVSLFVVSCLIIVAFLGSMVASQDVPDNTDQAPASSADNFAQRFKRTAGAGRQRSKRAYGFGMPSENGYGFPGARAYHPSNHMAAQALANMQAFDNEPRQLNRVNENPYDAMLGDMEPARF